LQQLGKQLLLGNGRSIKVMLQIGAHLKRFLSSAERPSAEWAVSLMLIYRLRCTSIFLVSAIASAGLRPFGQTVAQFMIV